MIGQRYPYMPGTKTCSRILSMGSVWGIHSVLGQTVKLWLSLNSLLAQATEQTQVRDRATSIVSRLAHSPEHAQSPMYFYILIRFLKYVRSLQSPPWSSDSKDFPFKVLVILLFSSTFFCHLRLCNVKHFSWLFSINTPREKAVCTGRALNKPNRDESYKYFLGNFLTMILECDCEWIPSSYFFSFPVPAGLLIFKSPTKVGRG